MLKNISQPGETPSLPSSVADGPTDAYAKVRHLAALAGASVLAACGAVDDSILGVDSGRFVNGPVDTGTWQSGGTGLDDTAESDDPSEIPCTPIVHLGTGEEFSDYEDLSKGAFVTVYGGPQGGKSFHGWFGLRVECPAVSMDTAHIFVKNPLGVVVMGDPNYDLAIKDTGFTSNCIDNPKDNSKVCAGFAVRTTNKFENIPSNDPGFFGESNTFQLVAEFPEYPELNTQQDLHFNDGRNL